MHYKKRSCKYTKRGRAFCKAPLPNGKEISKRYQDVKPEFMDVVEKDFKENILNPEIMRMQSKKGILGKGIKFLREKPSNCWQEFYFEDTDSLRIMKQIDRCIKKESRIKKIGSGIDKAINLAQYVQK
jgi:hypothetical protein